MLLREPPTQASLSPLSAKGSAMSLPPLALIAMALLWPLGAGLTLVLWTKARAEKRRRQVAALEQGLKGMFQSIEVQGVPSRMAFVVDALEEGEALRPARPRAPVAH